MKRSLCGALILAVVAALFALSCSCDGGNGTPTATPGGNATASPTANATASPTATATPVEYLEHVDEENGFAFSYPGNWTAVPPDYWGPDTAAFYSADETEWECSPQCSVSAVLLDPPMTVGEWFDQVSADLVADPAYTQLSVEEVTVGGLAGIEHGCTMGVGEGTFQAVQVYVVDESVGWTVTCLCTMECWERFGPVFETVVGSFRLLD